MASSNSKELAIIELIKQGKTIRQIARSLNVSEKVIKFVIKNNNLTAKKEYSHGQADLLEQLAKLFPYLLVVPEHPISSGLRIDAYIPSLKLGFEYDGIQHTEFVQFFHGTQENFEKGKTLDKNKEYLCHRQGIKLVRISKSISDEELAKHVASAISENL